MKILDVGSGPPRLTSTYPEVEITSCDTRSLPGVELQNMEKLTYPDNSFDVVICINALDHTINAEAALREIIRVAKGQIYINCALDQMTLHGKKHYWDAKANGEFVSDHPRTSGYGGATPLDDFDLKDYGFEIEHKDDRMIARKNG